MNTPSTPDASASGTFRIGNEMPVHRLGFGALWLGESTLGKSHEENLALIRRVAELNVTYIDTADAYAEQQSETLIGEALAPFPSNLLVGTKVGLYQNPDRKGYQRKADPAYIKRAVEDSLRRLRTDCIGLYHLHRIDPNTPFEVSLQAIADLRTAGKVRFVGLSEVTVEQIEIARRIVPIATVQNLYGIYDRQHEDVLHYCEREGIGFIPWGSLARGHLPGMGDTVSAIAAAHEATPAQIALAWNLKKSPALLPIPGTSSIKHLEQNVAAAHLTLSGVDMDRLDKLWTGKPMHDVHGNVIES